ncbi:hypothetical protein WH95_19580 [Kiloniella litopenaei]|uniref:Lysozyme inhibitor LprI N-terminal domain-containing protein n=1 Tax=Kiloniella litopenaei TaxID=1549748 RepID=A0A0M2R016_9PROT|nr:hypothetical protein [Kiloniella litopenaei]KKJ75222.1 hypothetical protein WH95_19580 [Kiloniella litopenaei]
MNKIFAGILLILFGLINVSAQAITFADKPYIDPGQLKNYQLLRKREKKECGSGLNLDCTNRVFDQWVAEGRLRGTNEYCDVHLVPQSNSELKRIAKELVKIKAGDGILNREPGEVTQKEIDHEIWCIDRILDDRNDSR